MLKLLHSPVGSLFAVLALVAASAACTVHSTDVPSLSGPSEYALSLNIIASPDSIVRDGISQSIVVVTARDTNGKGLPSVPLRVDMLVAGVLADFGTLSARNLVTS